MTEQQRWDDVQHAQAYGGGILRGQWVVLRELREEDLPRLQRWWNDPAVAVLQTASIRPQPTEKVADTFRGWSGNQDGSSVGFSVVKADSEDLVGHVALWGASPQTRCATLGIILGPEHTARGLGTDALRVLVRYGFTEMGLHRIQLGVFGFNSRAIAAYRKVGFREEGRRREAIFHDGRFHDEVLMGLLENDDRPAG